jgi:hypothetical protein
LTRTEKTGADVASAATGMKPDFMPWVKEVLETPMGTHGAANEDWVTVWFWRKG